MVHISEEMILDRDSLNQLKNTHAMIRGSTFQVKERTNAKALSQEQNIKKQGLNLGSSRECEQMRSERQ